MRDFDYFRIFQSLKHKIQMLKSFPIVLFLLLICYSLNAQVCEGKIIDSKTLESVENVNVFLEGTMIGTVSNSEGYFRLNTNGFSSLPLIIGTIGYGYIKIPEPYCSGKLEIKIDPVIYKLSEVTVNSGKWSRKKMLRIFKHEFLGDFAVKNQCEIQNEGNINLSYNSQTKILEANSIKPIVIKNNLLGYEITYFLEHFEKSKQALFFKGHYSFSEIKSSDEKQKQLFEERRKWAYYGSRMHFIRSLWRGYLASNGFTIYNVTNLKPINVQDILSVSEADRKYLFLADRIQVNYFQTCKFNSVSEFNGTVLLPKEEYTLIEPNGYFDPETINWYGLMGCQRVSELLPFEYQP
jgi:hypothetical protein